MNHRSQAALIRLSELVCVCVCVERFEPEAPSNNLWLSVSVRRSDVEFRSDSVSRSPGGRDGGREGGGRVRSGLSSPAVMDG